MSDREATGGTFGGVPVPGTAAGTSQPFRIKSASSASSRILASGLVQRAELGDNPVAVRHDYSFTGRSEPNVLAQPTVRRLIFRLLAWLTCSNAYLPDQLACRLIPVGRRGWMSQCLDCGVMCGASDSSATLRHARQRSGRQAKSEAYRFASQGLPEMPCTQLSRRNGGTPSERAAACSRLSRLTSGQPSRTASAK